MGTRNLFRGAMAGLLAVLAILLVTVDAHAKCFPMARGGGGVVPVALPAAGTVRLTFLGHSSFLIETAGGARAVTDYNGFITAPEPPDIVTMNNGHETHYTDFVEPEIEIALRGWDPKGGLAVHDLTYRDLRVWNVPTNERSFGGVVTNGNSIFVFEAADLCIGHLGHLHHTLSDTQLGELGLIDVLLVPVDGAFTMAQEFMVQVIEQIGAPLVIPMHYFNAETLGRFLRLIEHRYRPAFSEVPTVSLSRLTLPNRQVLVLPGR